MKTRIQRFREFTQYDLWRQPHMSMLSLQKRVLYRILQTIILVVRGFKDKVLNFRANSLSFALLFAFVPMLALMYAVARGFGFEQLVLEQLSGSFLAEAAALISFFQFWKLAILVRILRFAISSLRVASIFSRRALWSALTRAT
jgi:membrane protein